MLGNDVVDLQLAKLQTRWNSKAFQQKVLHPAEIENFKNKPLNFVDFWKIWSVKETAYKAHQRNYKHPPIFNPFDFFVEFISGNRSKVSVGNEVYSVHTFVNSDFIYAFTASKDLHSVQNFEINAENSSYKENFNRSEFNAQLIKDEFGIPFLIQKNELTPISLTHHGRFFAYVK